MAKWTFKTYSEKWGWIRSDALLYSFFI